MDQNIGMRLKDSIRNFWLPSYEQIPDVGLYLEQVTQYVSECIRPLGETITSSMISNYVKRGLIDNPVKKQYSRDQIAYLVYIGVVKMVLTMEDIRLTISVQRKSYDSAVAYEYFRMELENLLAVVFGLKDEPDIVGVENSGEKVMLRNTIIAVAHKVYLDKLFVQLHEEQEDK